MPDGTLPYPGGWNRIELVVEDLAGRAYRVGLGADSDVIADRVSASLVIGVMGLTVVGVGLWSAFRFGPINENRG